MSEGIHPSFDEIRRQHELAGLRDERDAALAEVERLREALLAVARVPHSGDGDSRECAVERGRIARQALDRRFGGDER